MLSIGAIVGVGVGGGIAGIAIGLAISFLYLSLRKRGRGEMPSQPPQETKPQLESSPSGPLLLEYSLTLYQRNLVQHLPGAMYKDKIIHTIHHIRSAIWHDPFYFKDLSSPRPRLNRDALIGLVGSRHADQLLQLIESGDSEEALKAAQLIYIRSILSRLDPKGDPETTLFPPDVLRVYQALLTHAEQKNPAHPHGRPALFKDYWRSLTGISYADQFSFNTASDIEVPQDDVRRQRAHELSVSLKNMLRPFGTNGEFAGNETATEDHILRIAVDAFALFSQVDTISVSWDDLWAVDERDGQRKLLLFPAFYQSVRHRDWASGSLIGVQQDPMELVQRTKPQFEFKDEITEPEPEWVSQRHQKEMEHLLRVSGRT